MDNVGVTRYTHHYCLVRALLTWRAGFEAAPYRAQASQESSIFDPFPGTGPAFVIISMSPSYFTPLPQSLWPNSTLDANPQTLLAGTPPLPHIRTYDRPTATGTAVRCTQSIGPNITRDELAGTDPAKSQTCSLPGPALPYFANPACDSNTAAGPFPLLESSPIANTPSSKLSLTQRYEEHWES